MSWLTELFSLRASRCGLVNHEIQQNIGVCAFLGRSKRNNAARHTKSGRGESSIASMLSNWRKHPSVALVVSSALETRIGDLLFNL